MCNLLSLIYYIKTAKYSADYLPGLLRFGIVLQPLSWENLGSHVIL